MPTTTTLKVASLAADSGSWSFQGGAADYTNLQSHDDDTTYAQADDSASAREEYGMDDLPAEAGSVQTVQVEFRAADFAGHSGGTVRAGFGLGGSYANGTTQDPTGSYTTYGPETIANRPGGSSGWSVADVNGSNLFLEKVAGGANTNVKVTYLEASVTWDVMPSGFAFLVAQWLGPVIGAALSLKDAFAIAWELSKLSGHRVHAREVPRLLEDLRLAWR